MHKSQQFSLNDCIVVFAARLMTFTLWKFDKVTLRKTEKLRFQKWRHCGDQRKKTYELYEIGELLKIVICLLSGLSEAATAPWLKHWFSVLKEVIGLNPSRVGHLVGKFFVSHSIIFQQILRNMRTLPYVKTIKLHIFSARWHCF